jgi:truncated hemoglobin YjbI
MTTPTVYEWADGAPAFKRRFYDQVEQNEPLAPLFPAASVASIASTWPTGGVR